MTSAKLSSTVSWSDAQAGARALAPISDPVNLLAGGLIVADAVTVIVSSAWSWLLRHGFGPFSLEVVSISLLATALTFNAMRIAGAYGQHVVAPATNQIGRALQSWSVVFVVLVLLAFVTKTSDDFSRAWAIGWYVLALVIFTLVRFMVARRAQHLRVSGRLARTVAVVDLAGRGEKLTRRILPHGEGQIRLVGVFGPQRTAGRRNGVADLIALARLFRIDEVIVAVSERQVTTLGETDAILRKLSTIPTNVRVCPEMPPLTVPPLEAGLVFGQPMLTVCHRPLSGWNRVGKRMEDIVLGSTALILVSPLMLLVALLIRLDSRGPALFRQQRLGFNNNVITVFKFRTMTHGRPAEDGVPQARRHDPRVTRLGRILRRTSVDELPQLFNVLRGDMSLVGPRPHALMHNEAFAVLIDDYLGRHRVQPGITGWAQVNGLRGETDTLEKMQRRVEHDLAYINRWSLLLDLRIMFLTVFRVAFDRNAY